MADAPRDDRLSAAGQCTLYYFPEIPSEGEADCRSPSRPGRFVSGSFTRVADDRTVEGENQDASPIEPQIEAAYQKGLVQGRAEIQAAQQETVNQAAAALEACVKEMFAIRQRDVACMEMETVRLALAIAKKIIGREIEYGTVIQHVVTTAMQKVNDPRQLIIRLNPGDIDAIQSIREELLAADDFDDALRIEADESVRRGGCIVETKLGDVDARIDSQIKIIEALLIDQLPRHKD